MNNRNIIKKSIILVVAGVLLVAIMVFLQLNYSRKNIGKPVLDADVASLKNTIVTPVLDMEIPKGKNVIWCLTFQLAWNELKKDVGGDVELKPMPELAKLLNKGKGSEKDIDSASYVALAGRNINAKIKRELAAKFHGQATPELADDPYVIAYAYLMKNLPFKHKFARFTDKLKFNGKPVQCFGFNEDDPGESQCEYQVAILDFVNSDDFIICLVPEGKEDIIILAKTAPGKTLKKTFATIERRIKRKHPESLMETKEFYIPVMDFKLNKNFQSFHDAIISNSSTLENVQLGCCRQIIRFKINESGAKLGSESALVENFLPSGKQNLIFDKPYLLMLKRRNADYPYFAMWVANPELMIPAE